MRGMRPGFQTSLIVSQDPRSFASLRMTMLRRDRRTPHEKTCYWLMSIHAIMATIQAIRPLLFESKDTAAYYSAVDFDVHSIGAHAECTRAQIVCVLTASNSEV